MLNKTKQEILERLAGKEAPYVEYIVQATHECSDRRDVLKSFATLDQALAYLKEKYGDDENLPCPEHDQILVWEVLPSGHRKIVWHFSGWHYNPDYYTTLPQGKLPGDEMSLYGRACLE